MKILLIEDDVNKRSNICAVLNREFSHLEITLKASRQSGLRAAVVDDFNAILLDMSLPLFEISRNEAGYEFRHFAGLEIMEEMVRHGKRTPIIVVTQFEVFGEPGSRMTFAELVKELERKFGSMFLGAVFYSPQKALWETQLVELLKANLLRTS